MKTVYWLGGIILSAVIGWVVWKMLDKRAAERTQNSNAEAQARNGQTLPPPTTAKVLTFTPPARSSIIKTQLSTGLGTKKGFF